MTNGPRKRREITVDAVFDIETEDWTTFVCGGFLTNDGIYKVCDWRHEEEFARFILSFEGTVWAHNGGGFDYKWLLDWLIRLYPGRKATVTAAGASIVGVRIGKLRLFDSYALVKISLDEFSQASDAHKLSTGLECECGEYCGGYCRIARDMPRVDYERVLEYLRGDCEALMQSLKKLMEFAAEQDIDLGATVGGSAWANVRRILDLPDAGADVSDYLFAREAYFGGRVQLLRPFSAAGWEYDVSSMYPSRLASFPVPIGKPGGSYGKDAKANFLDRAPGMYKCAVTVPRMHLCPLPVRTKERIIYPWGEFTGTWALPELLLAQELGCEINVRQALTWPDQQIVFKDWIDKLFHIRATAKGGKKGPFGTFMKYYMNSLTGKFGSRPDLERIIINPQDERVCTCKTDCHGACGCYTALDDAGFIVSQKTWRIEPCAHVEWAAYLTSEARCEWLRQALSLGDGGLCCVYGDTDSIFAEKEFTRNLGSELGQWESKGGYINFRGITLKVYSYERDSSLRLQAKGVSVPRLRGAPPEVRQASLKRCKREIEAGRSISASGVIGFRKGAADGKFFARASNKRHVSRGYGDRRYNPTLGITDPQEYYFEEEDDGE